eukprot:10284-Heterococcus_DN1.PRE.1
MSATDRAALRSKAVTLLSMLCDSALFFAVGLALWVSIPLFSAGTHPALSLCIRTGLASCCLLVWLDAIDSFLALMAMAATRCNAKLQRSQADPLHSLSLGEFWSRRWNCHMSDLLRTAVFRPMVKAMASTKWLRWLPRKEIATLCTFGMSGLLHGYPYLLLRG